MTGLHSILTKVTIDIAIGKRRELVVRAVLSTVLTGGQEGINLALALLLLLTNRFAL